MSVHSHFSGEEIFERVSASEPFPEIVGCDACEAEASSLRQLLGLLRRSDAELGAPTDWDDLLVRSRIREAISKEKPYPRSVFGRFSLLRPAFVSVLVAGVALAVWSPLSRFGDNEGTRVASVSPAAYAQLPAWTPFPAEEEEDEGLAVLEEWLPTEDEFAIARCRAACLGGLGDLEEESLLGVLAASAVRFPNAEASPL